MTISEPADQSLWARSPLRRVEQLTIATILIASFSFIAVRWMAHGGATGRLIEIDRAESRSIDFRVDINNADWPELTLLPGIGETLAKRIIDERILRGPFRAPSELTRVHGIGPRTVARIKPYLLPLPDAQDRDATAEEVEDR